MKQWRILGILLISAVLSVFISNVILVKKQALKTKTWEEGMTQFRAFDVDEGVIQRYQKEQKSHWLSSLTLNYLYQGSRLREFGEINRYSMYARLLPEGLAEEYEKQFACVLNDACYFPVPMDETKEVNINYSNSWLGVRTYGGNRQHEGCDIMPDKNVDSYFPVQSMSNGVVEKIGWLELGGYRIGIRSPSGAYYYYAHLSSYAYGLKAGDKVEAGQTIGKMGNTGYGPEGTSGKFQVHLHVGIYINWKGEEISINPYHLLKYVEKNRKTFSPNTE